MPVTDPDMPPPLKEAMEQMERDVQGFKTDISYQAPEQHDMLWAALQHDLAGTLRKLYNDLKPDEPYNPG